MNISNELREQLSRLVALKNGTNFEGEAAAATAAISRLLFRHNLEMSILDDIYVLEKGESEYVKDFHDIGVSTGDSFRWKSELLNIIARNNFCKAFREKKNFGQGYKSKIIIVGQPENIFVVKMIYNYLSKEISSYVRNAWKMAQTMNSYEENEWKSSFRLGILNRISERFQEVRKQVVAENATTNNALVIRKEKDLDDAVSDLVGGFKKAVNRTRNVNNSAYSGGIMAGNSFSLQCEVPKNKLLLPK
jgi:hypothetical protein